jgi:hypothetical protein
LLQGIREDPDRLTAGFVSGGHADLVHSLGATGYEREPSCNNSRRDRPSNFYRFRSYVARPHDSDAVQTEQRQLARTVQNGRCCTLEALSQAVRISVVERGHRDNAALEESIEPDGEPYPGIKKSTDPLSFH